MRPLRSIRNRRALLSSALALLVLAGSALAALPALKDLDIFMQVRSKVDELYVEPVSLEKMDFGALKGLLIGTDRYNGLIRAEDVFPYQPLPGSAELGLIIGADAESFRVVGVKPNSAAEKVGITPGDRLVAIGNDDFFQRQLSVYDAQKANYGPLGEKIDVAVYRENHAAVDEVPMTYQTVPGYSSVTSRELEPGYHQVKVLALNTEVDLNALAKAVDSVLAAQPKGVVLDLRGASEGDALLGPKAADLFLKDGKKLGNFSGYRPPKGAKGTTDSLEAFDDAFTASDGRAWPEGVKLDVLTGPGTVEAAEIMAGLLQQIGKFPVLGEPTAGKVTGFSTVGLPPDQKYRMILLTATFHMPDQNLTLIHGLGVEPDVKVTLNVPKLRVKGDKEDNGGKSLLEILSQAKHQQDKALETVVDHLKGKAPQKGEPVSWNSMPLGLEPEVAWGPYLG